MMDLAACRKRANDMHRRAQRAEAELAVALRIVAEYRTRMAFWGARQALTPNRPPTRSAVEATPSAPTG